MNFQSQGGELIFAAVIIFSFVFGMLMWGALTAISDIRKQHLEIEAAYRRLYNSVYKAIDKPPHPPFPDESKNPSGRVAPPAVPAPPYLPPPIADADIAGGFAATIVEADISIAQARQEKQLKEKREREFEKGNRRPISEVLSDIYESEEKQLNEK